MQRGGALFGNNANSCVFTVQFLCCVQLNILCPSLSVPFLQGMLENYKEAATPVLLYWNQTIATPQEAFRILRDALQSMNQNRIVAEVLDTEGGEGQQGSGSCG